MTAVVQSLGPAEMAEGDVTVGQCRQRCDRRHVLRWRVCERNAGQPDEALAEQRIGAFGRQGIVGEECVHGGQPGAVAVPQQIGHLHGRRPPRERQQPVAGTVAREIDQNIDPVSADQLGQLRVAQADRAAPVIAERTEAFGGGVLGRDARIEIEFDV